MDRRITSGSDIHPAPHILVQWSGGVESTSWLLHFLRDTSCIVTAHYVRMINAENRHPQEDAAISRLKPLLRNVRSFGFTSSELALVDGKGIYEDAQFQYPISLVAARNVGATRIYRAYCLEDRWIRYADGRREKRQEFCTHHKILSGFLNPPENLDGLCPPHYYSTKSKAWHWRNLGDLAHLTWSCRRPKFGMPCGSCHSCLEREAAKSGTSHIKEVADILQGNNDA